MKDKIRAFFIRENNNGYIWNIIAGLINASEAIILSMIITRTNGLTDAGILNIAFAVGNLFMHIGKFGVNTYQVSDIKHEFSFSDYFKARLVSMMFMLITSVIYLGVKITNAEYSYSKAAIVFIICMIYMVESLEDVFWGLYQQKNALDVGAKIFSVRWVMTLVGMSIVLIWRHDLFNAVLIGLIISCVVLGYSLYITYPFFGEKIVCRIGKGDFKVLKKCFPLFLVMFLTYYVINAPKYAIDRWLEEEVQACYGFIAMPIFVIGLLNQFIYRPVIVKMSMEWNDGDVKKLLSRVYKQCIIVAVITIICIAGAYIAGIPVLSILYATDLSEYKNALLILLTGGGMLALVGFFSVLMTIMRKQTWSMYVFIAFAVFDSVLYDYCVRNYDVLGVSISYLASMTLLAVIFWVMFMINVKKGAS